MLRNRGVNVTERRIRQDVLKAYEYDIFDAPRLKYMHEGRFQSQYYKQPRYRTIHNPVYHAVRSSISSYRRRGQLSGARRVYLPENEWGASSTESMVFVRNPRFNTGSYYPNEHIERPFRRDFRYTDGYYSRKPSSIYMDDDEIENYQASRFKTEYNPRRQLVRKVTRKLSPIITCDCATSSHAKQNAHGRKPQRDNLSKEAKVLSHDIFKILSMLRKAEGEDSVRSSLSVLQNIQDLECRNSNSVAKLVAQRVQISPTMTTRKHDNPKEKFKAATGVRSKLEALVIALKQYEKEKELNYLTNEFIKTDVANDPKYNNVIPSDPPSLEIRSSHGRYNRSSTIVDGSKLKDIVLQTEKPKTSNKNVCSKIKTKKDNMLVERKSLRSRLSWKKREASGLKNKNESSKEWLDSKIGSILEAKQSLPEKKSVQGQASNKAGLMIKIGGNPQRKKTKPPKETVKEKMPKTWIRKFLDTTKDCKNNNIYLRWNNKAFYTKSSSTIIELVNNVYKQLGIKNYAKTNDISISDIKKVTKHRRHRSQSKIPKSPTKEKYKQRLKAYMMPQTIVPGPVYMPVNATKHLDKLDPEKAILKTKSSCKLPGSSDYFEIHLPKNFFDSVSTAKVEDPIIPSSEKKVNRIIVNDTLLSDSIEGSITSDDFSITKCDSNGNVYINMGQVSQSVCLNHTSQYRESSKTKPVSEPTKSLTQSFPDQDSASVLCPRRSCSLADKILEDEYRNWMPFGSTDSIPVTDMFKDSDANVLIEDSDANIINLSTTLGNVDKESTNCHDTEKEVSNKLAPANMMEPFRTKSNNAININPIMLRGINSTSLIATTSKPDKLPVFWNLFWGFLNISVRDNKRNLLPQDLSSIHPPITASTPEFSSKPEKYNQAQQPVSTPAMLRTVKVGIPRESLNVVKQPSQSLQTDLNKEEEQLFNTEKDKIEEELRQSEQTKTDTQSFETKQDIIKAQAEQHGTDEQSFKTEKDIIETQDEQLFKAEQDKISDQPFQIEQDAIVEKLSLMEKYIEENQPLTKQDTLVQLSFPVEQDKPVEESFEIEYDKTNHQSFQPKQSKSDEQSLETNTIENEPPIPTTPLKLIELDRYDYTTTTETSEELVKVISLDKSLMPIKLSESQSKKLRQTSLKSKKRSHIMRLRRSSLKIPNKMKFVIKTSDPVLQQDLNKIELLCVEILNMKGLVHLKRKSSTQSQSRRSKNHNPCSKPCENDLQDTEIKSNVNKGQAKIIVCSQRQEEVKDPVEMFQNENNSMVVINKRQESTKTVLRKTKAKKHITYVTQMKNNDPLSKKHCIDFNKAKRLSLKITKGDNITKISINRLDKNKMDNTKLIKKPSSQETVANRGTIHRSTNTIPNKEVKVFINITNVNSGKIENKNQKSDHIIEDQKPTESAAEAHQDKKKSYDVRNYTTSDIPVYVVEATKPNFIYKNLIAVSETPCIIIYTNNAADKNYKKKTRKHTANKINDIDVKHVEIERILNAMMILNANEFANVANMNDPTVEKNKQHSAAKQPSLRRRKRQRELVQILNTLNMNNTNLECFEDNPTFRRHRESTDELESENSCCRCNVLRRKSNSYRLVDGREPTYFNFKENFHIAANYNIPQLPSTVLKKRFNTVDACNFKADSYNADNYDPTVKSKSNTSKKKKGTSPERNSIIWHCGKKYKKKHEKKWITEAIKELKCNRRKNDKISCKSSFTEYTVHLKGDDSFHEKDSVINKEDILQSYRIKKAVLQIYSESVANENYVVAKLPKYFRL